ncbi:alpha/beta fold hydrolase [Sphingomonas sp. CGMCC 1.13654]|uniref:Alpha/beta fold hydrolase n=1 Tax=Sphingomonas chungangi TaxID=2683589 RepID=A0A838L5U5_9SPHN|nr:alpha/beta fold hydrolase [Sphingomonas chungangi]MBA2933556.1 alpha/beta fold hydrolase [Sphingomonas chungangi]MVW54889.1 alpha/beta fold hydrolase [Sphingomonas chungangi]
MNHLIDTAQHLPVRECLQTISISPIRLEAAWRPYPLELRITAPVSGSDLPILLLSHGDGPSLYLPSKDGYGPLANFYAEQGFVVVQPSHANSKIAGLPRDRPGAPLFWRERVQEMTLILDRLEDIEAGTPAFTGRFDHDRIAAVGHSMGGQTVGMLLGAHLTDPKDATATDVDMFESRIKAGVLLTPPGRGGDDLSDFVRENFSFLNPDYTHLRTRALVVVGDADTNPFMTVRGPEWYDAAYNDGPACDAKLTIHGGRHGIGGIAGYDAKETDDEDPDRLATVQRMTSAYLRSALYVDDLSWPEACTALTDKAGNLGHVDTKFVG